MTLSTIIAKKREEFDEIWPKYSEEMHIENFRDFLEKAIRESVEEALREVRPGMEHPLIVNTPDSWDSQVKEFMK